MVGKETKAEIIEQFPNIYLVVRNGRKGFRAYYPKPLSLRRLRSILDRHPRMMNGRIFYQV